jgi:predicted DCC family thiol-disulfide oxidoreductase YuxK
MATAPAAVPSPAAFQRLVLFDGVCGFCDATVRWLLDRDSEGRLHFAALQGETAAALRRRHPEIPDAIDALVYVDATDGSERVYLRSEAVFRIWAEVEPTRPLLRWLRRLPRPLTDLGYRLFARLRYRLFGRVDACRVPSPEERARFLP